MGKKKFEGSWLILIVLIILCWPAALIYFFIKYQDNEEETRTCMGCGANISITYATCPYCGRSTVEQYAQQQYQAPQPAVGQTSNDQVGFCKNCGAGISSEQDFCISCGTKLK
jgi:predicted amidophosphoribosyltransferase